MVSIFPFRSFCLPSLLSSSFFYVQQYEYLFDFIASQSHWQSFDDRKGVESWRAWDRVYLEVKFSVQTNHSGHCHPFASWSLYFNFRVTWYLIDISIILVLCSIPGNDMSRAGMNPKSRGPTTGHFTAVARFPIIYILSPGTGKKAISVHIEKETVISCRKMDSFFAPSSGRKLNARSIGLCFSRSSRKRSFGLNKQKYKNMQVLRMGR